MLSHERIVVGGGLSAVPGLATAARAELVVLERTAREKGFGLIAGKALSVRNNGDKRTQ